MDALGSNQNCARYRRWRPLIVVATVLAIVGSVGGCGFFQGGPLSSAGATSTQRTATPGPIRPLLSIDTSAAERCPTGVAWSPDGLTIAVAADGEQDRCDTADPGRLAALVNNGDSQIIVWGASSLASLPPVAA